MLCMFDLLGFRRRFSHQTSSMMLMAGSGQLDAKSLQAVECEVGQIGKTQKATRELNGRIDGRSAFGSKLGTTSVVCCAVRFWIPVGTDGDPLALRNIE